MMRLILLILILLAGWWNSLDATGSIIEGLHKVKGKEFTAKEKFLLTVRLIRGLFGLMLIVAAFILK